MKTITEMFIDDDGNHKTKLWYPDGSGAHVYQAMKIIPTHKSQIRHHRETCLYTVGSNSIISERERVFNTGTKKLFGKGGK